MAYLFRGKSLLDRAILQHRQTKWLLGFVSVAAIVTPFAVSPDRSLHYLIILVKLTLLYFLIVGTVRTHKQFRWFVMAMILGGLLWGINTYDDPRISDAGRLAGVGGPDSFDNNAAAAHLVSLLPFIGIYFLSGNYREKLICLIAAPFVLNTIILINSRGATIALVVAAVVGLVLARGKARFQIAGMLLLAAIVFLLLVGQPFIDRQLTLFEYWKDNSATARLDSWKGAIELAKDYPLGAGGGGYKILSPVYIPEIVASHQGQLRSVHNSYLVVWTDWGILGLIAFLGLIGSTLWELHQIRRSTSDRRLQLDSLALEVALIAFLTSAFFIVKTYGEILYWLVGLTAVLRNVQLGDQESS